MSATVTHRPWCTAHEERDAELDAPGYSGTCSTSPARLGPFDVSLVSDDDGGPAVYLNDLGDGELTIPEARRLIAELQRLLQLCDEATPAEPGGTPCAFLACPAPAAELPVSLRDGAPIRTCQAHRDALLTVTGEALYRRECAS